jgi:hypothetical protein
MSRPIIKNPWTYSIVWGLIGALFTGIILKIQFTVDKRYIQDIICLVIFSTCLIGLSATIRIGKHRRKFLTVFLASIITWMTMPIVLHIIRAIQLGGYNFWWVTPFFQMLGLGILFCAPLAWLTVRLRKKSLTV